MRTSVWKFPLSVADVQNVRMPKNSEVLSVAVQADQLCIWALVELDQEAEEIHTIATLGTGHTRTDLSGSDVGFIGTVLLAGGSLVFHVFDLGVADG